MKQRKKENAEEDFVTVSETLDESLTQAAWITLLLEHHTTSAAPKKNPGS